VIIKKSYKNLIKNLNSRQVMSLVEYFELKITDNQSDDFLRMLSKMTYRFSRHTVFLRKS